MEQKLVKHVRSLKSQGIDEETYGVILTPMIVSKLPEDVALEWSRKGEGKESDLPFLMNFLTTEVQNRERSEVYRDKKSHVTQVKERRKEDKRQGTATALHAVKETSEDSCGLCNGNHGTELCLLKVPSDQRRRTVQKAGLCFKCLRGGHLSMNCNHDLACAHCGGSHHELLHVNRQPKQKCKVDSNAQVQSGNKAEEVKATSNVSCHVNTNQVDSFNVVFQLAEVSVVGAEGQVVRVHVMFDSGSDSSYVSTPFVRRVDPKYLGIKIMTVSHFGGATAEPVEARVFELKMKAADGSIIPLQVSEVPKVCAPLRRRKIPVYSLMPLKLSDLAMLSVADVECEIHIDVLIGLDTYWKFVGTECLRLSSEGLTAQESRFGWLVSGRVSDQTGQSSLFSHNLHVCTVSDSLVRELWELDSVGVGCPLAECEADPVMREFKETVVHSDKRYQVSLPWKSEFREGKLVLMDNKRHAQKRLDSLQRRLAADEELSSQYNRAIRTMEENDIIHEVPEQEMETDNPIFYLPHHPVVKESSLTTKVRPVFDASAAGENGISLNHCVNAGPSLLPDLVAVLLRFRRWAVAVTADVEKAFLQVQIRPEDRDAHRFLWSDDSVGLVRVMRFARVPFGNKCSPFLLNATLKYHLSRYEDSFVVQELKSNLYVDDWLSGADTEEEAVAMFMEARRIMSEASMPLVKWQSSSHSFVHLMQNSSSDANLFTSADKVLGVKWDSSSDHFGFDGVTVLQDVVVTKRAVLNVIGPSI